MRTLLSVGLILVLAAGCHSRFKKHVGAIDDVKPAMLVTTGPHVSLGGVDGDGLAAAVINTVQTVKSIDLTKKINEAVEPQKVGAAFTSSLDETIADAPFDIDPASDHTLQIELLAYGIDVAALGMPGALTYQLRTRLYLPDGKVVYNARHNCAMAFSDPKTVSIVFGTVNNAAAIKDMRPKEIQRMFEGGAEYCAQITAARIRRHGG